MAYDFKSLKEGIKNAEERLAKEFSGLRTGRAAPSLLDGILVDSYGTKMPINQLASVSIEDPRTLRIIPWNLSQAKDIEKAVVVANLGVSAAVDEKGVRIFFPELTAERRQSLLKIAKGKLEEARVALRTERDKVWSDIQEKAREGKISEDEKFRAKDEMQKLVDEGNTKFEAMMERKEKEMLS